MKTESRQKTALKLVNKYADSYNFLLNENKSLKDEIKDLKQNLFLNKELLKEVFKEIKEKKKGSFNKLIQQLSNENMAIYKQMNKISEERNKLRNELLQIKEEKISGEDEINQENFQLKTKLFLLEQEIIKKNNQLKVVLKKYPNKQQIIKTENENNVKERNKSQNIKSKNIFKNEEYKNIIYNKSKEKIKEVYILDPSIALVELNGQLLFYKENYEKVMKNLIKKQEAVKKYEKMITKLDNENINVKKRFQLKLMNVNKEKENILSMLTKSNQINNSSKSATNIGTLTTTIGEYNLKQKDSEQKEACGKEETIEEFSSILKAVGLSRENFDKLCKIKECRKLTDSIEFFYKLVLDKNKQIFILEHENEELIFKNFEVNKENIELEKILNKNKIKYSKIKNNKKENNILNDSMNNNLSNISKNTSEQNKDLKILNNKNDKLNNIKVKYNFDISNYKKLIEKQREEDELKKADVIFDINLSTENEVEPSNGITKTKKIAINENNANEDNEDYGEEDEEEEEEEKESSLDNNSKSCSANIQIKNIITEKLESIRDNKNNNSNNIEKEKKNGNGVFDYQETLTSLDFRKGVDEEIKKQNENKIKITFADSIKI